MQFKDFIEEHKKLIYTVGACIIAVALLAAGIVYYVTQGDDTLILNNDKEVSLEQSGLGGEEIVVHIKGGVKDPGLYTVRKGARIADVIDAAGGTGLNTDELDEVNLAEKVTDGQEIVIPGVYFAEPVNINTASVAELAQVPGMPKWLARDIPAYREQNGLFESIEEVLEIPGVLIEEYKAIENYIAVEDVEKNQTTPL